jgi:hypothetical protein
VLEKEQKVWQGKQDTIYEVAGYININISYNVLISGKLRYQTFTYTEMWDNNIHRMKVTFIDSIEDLSMEDTRHMEIKLQYYKKINGIRYDR